MLNLTGSPQTKYHLLLWWFSICNKKLKDQIKLPIQLVGDDPPYPHIPRVMAWAPHHAGWEDGCPRRHCAGADDQTHQEHQPPRHGIRGMDITNIG